MFRFGKRAVPRPESEDDLAEPDCRTGKKDMDPDERHREAYGTDSMVANHQHNFNESSAAKRQRGKSKEIVDLTMDDGDTIGSQPGGLPRELSGFVTSHLPPRVGDVAQTAESRKDIRHSAIEMLTRQHSYMARAQCTASIFKEKHAKSRGRILGMGHVTAARELVQSKVATSQYRDRDLFDATWDAEDNEFETEECDMLARGVGRNDQQDNQSEPPLPIDDDMPEPPIPGGSKSGYQYSLPDKDPSELIGWNAKATFPTGRKKERRWHDGFIINYSQASNGSVDYLIFFNIDGQGEWIKGEDLPNHGVCFRKPHLQNTKVTEDDVRCARSMCDE